MGLSRLLRIGSHGDDVVEVQTMLNIIGARFGIYLNNPPSLLHQLKMDGTFGPKTQARVWEFQNDRGLSPDAIVGPDTYGAMRSMGVPAGVNPSSFIGSFVLQDLKRGLRALGMLLFLGDLRLFNGERRRLGV
jgi:peptidoglycan hydrolase-like protein with peptidoglycan-binding domain